MRSFFHKDLLVR